MAIILALWLTLCFFAPLAFAGGSAKLFTVKGAAEAHCPGDIIVWFNTRTDTYYFYGESQYEHTAQGAYACEKEVNGLRNSTTGQH